MGASDLVVTRARSGGQSSTINMARDISYHCEELVDGLNASVNQATDGVLSRFVSSTHFQLPPVNRMLSPPPPPQIGGHPIPARDVKVGSI